MLTKKFIETALAIRREAPRSVWEALCKTLQSSTASDGKSVLLLKSPAYFNSDLAFLFNALLSEEQVGLTFREIGFCLEAIGEAQDRVSSEVSRLT